MDEELSKIDVTKVRERLKELKDKILELEAVLDASNAPQTNQERLSTSV